MDKESTGYSAGNYGLSDEEYTVRIILPPGIVSSGTRNPPKEGDSVGNHQLMEADSNQQDARKILQTVTISGSSILNQILLKHLF
jgi:hypothetical protein